MVPDEDEEFGNFSDDEVSIDVPSASDATCSNTGVKLCQSKDTITDAELSAHALIPTSEIKPVIDTANNATETDSEIIINHQKESSLTKVNELRMHSSNSSNGIEEKRKPITITENKSTSKKTTNVKETLKRQTGGMSSVCADTNTDNVICGELALQNFIMRNNQSAASTAESGSFENRSNKANSFTNKTKVKETENPCESNEMTPAAYSESMTSKISDTSSPFSDKEQELSEEYSVIDTSDVNSSTDDSFEEELTDDDDTSQEEDDENGEIADSEVDEEMLQILSDAQKCASNNEVKIEIIKMDDTGAFDDTSSRTYVYTPVSSNSSGKHDYVRQWIETDVNPEDNSSNSENESDLATEKDWESDSNSSEIKLASSAITDDQNKENDKCKTYGSVDASHVITQTAPMKDDIAANTNVEQLNDSHSKTMMLNKASEQVSVTATEPNTAYENARHLRKLKLRTRVRQRLVSSNITCANYDLRSFERPISAPIRLHSNSEYIGLLNYRRFDKLQSDSTKPNNLSQYLRSSSCNNDSLEIIDTLPQDALRRTPSEAHIRLRSPRSLIKSDTTVVSDHLQSKEFISKPEYDSKIDTGARKNSTELCSQLIRHNEYSVSQNNDASVSVVSDIKPATRDHLLPSLNRKGNCDVEKDKKYDARSSKIEGGNENSQCSPKNKCPNDSKINQPRPPINTIGTSSNKVKLVKRKACLDLTSNISTMSSSQAEHVKPINSERRNKIDVMDNTSLCAINTRDNACCDNERSNSFIKCPESGNNISTIGTVNADRDVPVPINEKRQRHSSTSKIQRHSTSAASRPSKSATSRCLSSPFTDTARLLKIRRQFRLNCDGDAKNGQQSVVKDTSGRYAVVLGMLCIMFI